MTRSCEASELFQAIGDADTWYEHVRTHPSCEEVRQRLNEHWRIYQPFAESSFQRDLATNFPQRSWELRLAASLVHCGGELRHAGNDGPDLCARFDGVDVYVEAIERDAGNGQERVAPVPLNQPVFRIDREAVMARLLGAVREKAASRKHYQARGRLPQTAPFVIAVNAGRITGAQPRHHIPDIVSALFGIEPVFEVPVVLEDELESSTEADVRLVLRSMERRKVRKRKVGAFMDPDNEHALSISAVVFSGMTAWDHPDADGGDMIVVRNPHATVPLPPMALRLGRVYRLQGDALEMDDHRPPPARRLSWSGWSIYQAVRKVRLRPTISCSRSVGSTAAPGDRLLVTESRGRQVRVMNLRSGTPCRQGWVPKKYLRGPL